MNLKRLFVLFIASVVVISTTIAGKTDSGAWVHFSGDGHSIVVEVDGISKFEAVSSAVFNDGNTTHQGLPTDWEGQSHHGYNRPHGPNRYNL